MPFTLTHTLAIVPIAYLWSGRGVFPALLIGSMVPDWPLYVPYGPRYELTHSFAGILLACLPLGLMISAFYLLKSALYELLPRPLQARLAADIVAQPFFETRTLLLTAAAVTVGAATHISWDAFTHYGQWGVALVPRLNQHITLTENFGMPLFALLQHGSTFVGFPIFLLLFASWFWRSKEYTVPPPVLTRSLRLFWIAVLTLIPLGFITIMLIDLALAPSSRSVFRVLFAGVTRAGLALMVLLLCYGIFFAWVTRQQPRVQ